MTKGRSKAHNPTCPQPYAQANKATAGLKLYSITKLDYIHDNEINVLP